MWAESLAAAEEQHLPAAHSSALRQELLTEAEGAIEICTSRNGDNGPAAEWLREVGMLLGAARDARGNFEAELGALADVDDDMVSSTSGGARAWRERTAAYATTVAQHAAPRPPLVTPTPAGKTPARGFECTT